MPDLCGPRVLLSLIYCCSAHEIALGALGVGGRNMAIAAAAFIDYQKNWNASLAARLGPPIVTIPGGVHPNATGAISLRIDRTFGSQEVGMAAALEQMSGTPIVGLIGPSYSSVTMPIATVAAVRKIPQISCCATNPALSSKDSYPYFLRTVPPDSLQARALWYWILQFQIPLAGCLYSVEAYGQGLFDALKELARGHGEQDRVQGQALRNMEQEFVMEEARASVRLLKEIGSHFIILLVSWGLAAPVLDVVNQEGMLSAAWQIVASETMKDHILAQPKVGFMYFQPSGIGAKFSELQQLWSLLGPEDYNSADQLRVSSDTAEDMITRRGAASELSPFEAFAFDAAYAFLVAINQLLHSGTDPDEVKGQILLDELHRLSFAGTSGEVSFDENGDRFGTYDLMNIQSDGSVSVAASFNSNTATFAFRSQLVWMDGSAGSLPPPELHSCDPGFYKEEQSNQCKKCPRGMMCWGGPTASFMSCPRGTFAPDTGMMNCTPCPSGTFALNVASVECSPCQPGTEGPQEGQETCVSCASGFYMPSTGAAQCLPCGKMQITPGTGSTRESDCVCAENSFMCGDRGCIPCPTGLHCPEGLGSPKQQAGFWADPNVSQCDFSVLRCRDQFECPAGVLGACSNGREGLACNNCQPGHYPQGSTCQDCSEGDAMPVVLLILLFLCILFFFSGSRWDPSQVSLNTVTTASVAGQLIMAIQALGSIRELSIEWQEPVKTLINLTKIVMFDFHFVRSSCFLGTDNPVLYFVSRLLTCPIACILLVCCWVLNKMRGRPKPFNLVMNQCGLLIFAFFLSIARSTLVPFQCVLNPNGSSSMLLHPGIICYQSEEHGLFAVLAVVGILTQPVAVLALATYVIVSYPSRVASGKGLRFSTRYRFLLHRFKPEAYYYGLVLLYRNALVALLPTVLVGIPELQVPLMGAILIAVQNLQMHIAPWRTELANVVDMLLTELLLLMLLSAGPLLLTDDTQSVAVLGWLLCVPIVAMMLVAFLGFARLAAKHFRSKEKLYGIFLCHHKAGGGSLSRLLKILIAQHSSTRVFLDSDQLENLDFLFDIIRTSAKNMVVVLTTELLTRSWCAGEIVTAWKNGITTVPLVCDGFETLSDEALKQIPGLWTPQQVAQLTNYGVENDDINAAYVWLQHELTILRMPRFGPVSAREAVVLELLRVCGVPSTLGQRQISADATSSRPRVLIISSLKDAESLSACEVFQLLLQAALHIECEVVHGIQQMATCRPYAYYLAVLLFRGVFLDQDFIKLLLCATNPSSQRTLQIVPIIADGFTFPIDIVKPNTQGTAFGAHQDKVLRDLRTILALPFSPLASEGLQQRQVAEIALRLHRYQDLVAAATLDENEDQFVNTSSFLHQSLEAELRVDPSAESEEDMVEVAF